MALAPAHVRWAAGDCACPPGCWCARAHPALLMAIVDAIEWPGLEFPTRHCLNGSPVTGVAPATHLWRPKSEQRMSHDAETHPLTPLAELYSTARAWNDHSAAVCRSRADFGSVKAKTLMNSDVALILEHKRDMMQKKGIQPKNDFLKAYQYVNTVKPEA